MGRTAPMHDLATFQDREVRSSGNETAVPRTIRCSCGQIFRARQDEELYSLIRGHIDPMHPEQHHRTVGPMDRLGVTMTPRSTSDTQDTRRRVVVVEDELSVAGLIQDLLESHGFVVVGVDSPNLVHLLDATLDPALFLVDVMLPGMSGVELAAQLQQTAYRQIPMIAMSASPLLLDLARRSQLFADTMAKPFDVTTLLEVVDHFALPSGSPAAHV